MHHRLLPIALALCSLSLAEDSAARTWIVDIAGGAGSDFRSIQAAVDAASDGDAILIRAGAYHEQVRIDGKGLSLVGLSGAVVIGIAENSTPAPLLHVVNLPAHRAIHLLNLGITRISRTPGVVLKLENNAGRVFADAVFLDNYDGTALSITNCASVVFRDVRAQANAAIVTVQGIDQAVPGTMIERGSRVSWTGGWSFGSRRGPIGSNAAMPVPGGAGMRIYDSMVDLVEIDCEGGSGASLLIGTCLHAAAGGPGLEVDAPLGLPTQVRVRGGGVHAGSAGFFHVACAPHPGTTPDIIDPLGLVRLLPETPRVLSLPPLPDRNGAFELTFSGEPGDLAVGWIAIQTTAPVTIPGVDGMLCLDLNQSILAFSGPLNAFGNGLVTGRFQSPGDPVLLHVQVVSLDRAGALWLSNPGTMLLP